MMVFKTGNVPYNKGKTGFVGPNRGKKFSEIWCKNMGLSHKGKAMSAETLHKILSASGKHPNYIEQYIDAVLQLNFPGEYKYTGDGSFMVENHNPDFVNCNGKKIVIEFDGKYWHNRSNSDKLNDIRRNESYTKYGYSVLVLNEDDLTESIILNKVKSIGNTHV